MLSPGKTLEDTQIDIEAAIWASQDSVKMTYEINHHSDVNPSAEFH